MSGRHTGELHSHTVEGTDPQLYVQVHEPQNDAGLRPVLLLHGFSSSSKLNCCRSCSTPACGRCATATRPAGST